MHVVLDGLAVAFAAWFILTIVVDSFIVTLTAGVFLGMAVSSSHNFFHQVHV